MPPKIYGENALKESGNIRQAVASQLRVFIGSEKLLAGGYWLNELGKAAVEVTRKTLLLD